MAKQKNENIKVNVVETQPVSVTLSVEVPREDVAAETEKVYNEIQRQARVPGFRQGKAPMDLIKRNYVSAAREKVVENLVQRTVFSSLQSQGIEPVSYPRVEDLDFDFDKPMTYKVKAERHPEVKAKDYKGLKITKEIVEINDAKVKDSIQALRERNARLEDSKSDTVKAGDFVLIDYDGFLNNEPVKELKAKNQLVDLSAEQTLPGFKEGLVGAKKGEEKEIKVKMPADFPNKTLADKDVILKAKVQGIKEKILPAMDDEFAKDLGAESLKDLETKVKESLDTEEKHRQEQETEKQLIDALLESNKFPVPESLVEEQLKYLIGRVVEYFRQQGLGEQAVEKNLGQYREKYKEEAERKVRFSYILNAIASEEKIDLTEDDLKAELERLKKANPGKEADVEKYFNEHKDNIAARMKEEKIFKFLTDNAKIKEETKKEPKKGAKKD